MTGPPPYPGTPLRADSASLVARGRAGDDRAWAELVETYSRYVHAITTRVFRLSQHDAEDVFQEVFTRAYTNLDSIRDDGAIKPWLAQVTRRLAIDRLRASGREGPSVDEDLPLEPKGVEDEFAKLDEALTVRAALETLPEHCADILDRFFARDQDYRTIGTQLGIPPG